MPAKSGSGFDWYLSSPVIQLINTCADLCAFPDTILKSTACISAEAATPSSERLALQNRGGRCVMFPISASKLASWHPSLCISVGNTVVLCNKAIAGREKN